MSERELRDGLALAVAHEPPLSFDPDDVVVRARRETARRRALVGVGTATAAVAIAAVAVPLALHPNTRATAPAAAVRLSTTAKPSPTTTTRTWPPAGVRTPSFDQSALTQKSAAWTTEVEAFVHHTLPSATALSVQPWGGEQSGSIQAGQGYLDTFAPFTVNGGRTALAVQVEAPGDDTTRPDKLCAEESGSHCQIGWQGDQLIVVDPLAMQGGAQMVTVRDYRPDGSVVFATAYNYNPTGSDEHVTMAAPPFTTAQLTTLVEDAALSF